MEIYRSIDIEDAVRGVLSEHQTAYCAPLPADYDLPNILIQATGGDSASTASGRGKVDTFVVVIDARAETEDEAFSYLRTAVALLEASLGQEGIAHVGVNSLYSWGSDPVRPDLALCSATLTVTAHREKVEI